MQDAPDCCSGDGDAFSGEMPDEGVCASVEAVVGQLTAQFQDAVAGRLTFLGGDACGASGAGSKAASPSSSQR